jgi:hypothetical protein
MANPFNPAPTQFNRYLRTYGNASSNPYYSGPQTATGIPTGQTAQPRPATTTSSTGIPTGTSWQDSSVIDPTMPYTPAQHGGDYTVPAGVTTTTPNGIPNSPTIPTAPAPVAKPATTPKTNYSATAPAGWDQGKWANPEHQTAKYAVGRILSQYTPSPEGLQSALAEIQALFPGTKILGTDGLYIPGVGTIDVGGNFNDDIQGNENWWWGAELDANGNPYPDAAGASGAAGGASGAGGSGLYGGAGGTGSGRSQSGYDGLVAQLQQFINQSPVDVSTNPAYRGAIDAYNAQQQRGAESTRNAIAERMAASGQTNSGAYDAQLLKADQTADLNSASFAGDLGYRALESQRDDILQALQIGAGLMTAEQEMALREKLGMINAELSQQQIWNQNNQFNQNLGWLMDQWDWLQDLIPYQQG